jgi:hypothetical protein
MLKGQRRLISELYVRFAVGGGADLVRNVNLALAGEASYNCRVGTGDERRKFFQALTNSLSVGCGLGTTVDGSNPLAAGWRDSPSTVIPNVG